MITGEDVIDFIRNCKLEDKIICRNNSDALMFIVKDEWNSDSQRSDFEYIGIDKQTGRYFKSKTVNETVIIPTSEEGRVIELKPYQFCGADMLSHKIVVKGNCTACGKPLGENDGLFLCAECQKKQDGRN